MDHPIAEIGEPDPELAQLAFDLRAGGKRCRRSGGVQVVQIFPDEAVDLCGVPFRQPLDEFGDGFEASSGPVVDGLRACDTSSRVEPALLSPFGLRRRRRQDPVAENATQSV
jgi:hypothetical protein